jgi:hypothetical protein
MASAGWPQVEGDDRTTVQRAVRRYGSVDAPPEIVGHGRRIVILRVIAIELDIAERFTGSRPVQ